MSRARQIIKHYAPQFVHGAVQKIRSGLAAEPIEQSKLHDYNVVKDGNPRRRLSLVIPSISPSAAYGGVLTGIDIFLDIALKAQTDLRVIVDDQATQVDRSVLDGRARARGIEPAVIEVDPRRENTPTVSIRKNDVFITFNWWVTLNVRQLVIKQAACFGQEVLPYIYLVQDYEPQFYPFSSTHMFARSALDAQARHWVILNSHQLREYYDLQGHAAERMFVVEPMLSSSLRPFLLSDTEARRKRVLVYGRPNIPRNCFPAICQGLSHWINSGPEHKDWEIVSAGEAHKPVRLAEGRSIDSLGKLSLEDYAKLLLTSSIGISLMSSPHPSYPPLEMAHFGLSTITNNYTMKELSGFHSNIISIPDIASATISSALHLACSRFGLEQSPRTQTDDFLRRDPFTSLDLLVESLAHDVWGA